MPRQKKVKPAVTTLRMPVISKKGKLVQQHAILPQYTRQQAEEMAAREWLKLSQHRGVLVEDRSHWLPTSYVLVDPWHRPNSATNIPKNAPRAARRSTKLPKPGSKAWQTLPVLDTDIAEVVIAYPQHTVS